MKTKHEEFEVLVPDLDGTGIAERVKVTVPLKWDAELQEWLLTTEAHEIIEDTKARHMGLLLPAQFRELRDRYRYSQKEMGELFQVGEKSWTRWETGKHRPSRSINLLIRALYEGKLPINYLLKRAGKPPRQETTWGEKAFHVFRGGWHPCPGAPPKPDVIFYGRGEDAVVVVRYASSAENQSPLALFDKLLAYQYESFNLAAATPSTTERPTAPATAHIRRRPSLLPTES
jgi:DNA-binding transcriptional regulator YiaG